MGAVLTPSSIKLNGCAITVQPTLAVRDWQFLWRDWPWTTWIKPQIDYAVGACGINCVSMLMSHTAVREGMITLATAKTQLQQVLSYCAGLGVWVLLRGEDPYHITHNSSYSTTTVTDASIISFLNSMMSTAAAYANLVGLDALPESDQPWAPGTTMFDAGGQTRTNTIMAGVKSSYPSVPLTSSQTAIPSDTSSRSFVSGLSSLDFLSFDAYPQNGWPNPIGYSDMAYWRSTYPSHDILFIEAGSSQNNSADAQTTFLSAIAALANSGDSRFRGWIHWAGQDQDNISQDPSMDNFWGLFDANWTPRANKVNVLRRVTGGTVLARA